jgi:hypothetical protein
LLRRLRRYSEKLADFGKAETLQEVVDDLLLTAGAFAFKTNKAPFEQHITFLKSTS